MVLNHYGFISLNKEAIFNAMNTGYQTLRDKIGQTVESCGSPSQCFHDNILNSGIPRENIISALVGTGVGFTAGLIIF
nr:hypothetical protein [Babesia bovis]